MIPLLVYGVLVLAGVSSSTPVTCSATPTVVAGSTEAYSYTTWPPDVAIVLGADVCANLRSDVPETRAVAAYITLHEADHVRIFDAGGGAEECQDQTLEAGQMRELVARIVSRRAFERALEAVQVFATRESYALGCTTIRVGP